MSFEIRPPYILFHDNQPAEQVALSVNGLSLPFHAHASLFSDAKREYAWAFEGRVHEGATVTFTSKDRQVTGVVRGASIVVGPTAIKPSVPVTASKPKQKK